MTPQKPAIGRRRFLAAAGGALALPVLGLEDLHARAEGEPMLPTPPPFGEVSHLGWVVKDLDKTVAYWEKAGLGSFSVDRDQAIRGQYRGKPLDIRLRWAWATLGGVGIELFQPAAGESLYHEYAARHGEGVQHLAFSLESPEALEAAVERADAAGVTVAQRGTFKNAGGEGLFAYLDTEPTGGLTFELVYDPNQLRERSSGAAPHEDHQYPFGRIIQYASVVKDIDQVCDFYRRLGFPVRGIDRDNAGIGRRYRGEREDFRMHMGWSLAGSTQFEIIQPTAGRSIYKEFLERHGEGFQHIALEVRDMDEAVRLFAERGVEVSQDGAWGKDGKVEGRFAYLDTDAEGGGLTIELLWSKA
ncbi:VOC family protein [bacterium]|nr:VOC family protein [bacterium]